MAIDRCPYHTAWLLGYQIKNMRMKGLEHVDRKYPIYDHHHYAIVDHSKTIVALTTISVTGRFKGSRLEVPTRRFVPAIEVGDYMSFI